MPYLKPIFDPFDGLSKQDRRFDPFNTESDPDPANLVGELQARVAYLEELSDVQTADRIISHLRFSRANLETMLDLAEEEIAALQAERDVPIENWEGGMLTLALREVRSLRAERDAALNDLNLQKEQLHLFIRSSTIRRQKLEVAIEQAISILVLRCLDATLEADQLDSVVQDTVAMLRSGGSIAAREVPHG